MGLGDFLRGQVIDIIEWLDATSDTIAHRFPGTHQNAIKYGAMLTVREGQAAVFINEGQLADVFGPGQYRLTTRTMPILSKLQGWAYGFESPFKSDVIFVNTRQFTDQKWGTGNPIMLRDAEFGPIRLRARGIYSFKVSDPGLFIKEIVGTDGEFTTEQITGQLRSLIVSSFSDKLAESKIPALDLAANYDELSAGFKDKIGTEFNTHGLSVVKFAVENISLPEEVEKVLDQRTGMGIIGDKMDTFMKYQAAQALEKGAENPGGGGAEGMGAGLGMGAGIAMGNLMGQMMQQGQQPPPQQGQGGGTPPVTPQGGGGGDTKPCASCQHPLPAEAKFCSECGTQQPEEPEGTMKFCTQCGHQNPHDAKFCSECGAPQGA